MNVVVTRNKCDFTQKQGTWNQDHFQRRHKPHWTWPWSNTYLSLFAGLLYSRPPTLTLDPLYRRTPSAPATLIILVLGCPKFIPTSGTLLSLFPWPGASSASFLASHQPDFMSLLLPSQKKRLIKKPHVNTLGPVIFFLYPSWIISLSKMILFVCLLLYYLSPLPRPVLSNLVATSRMWLLSTWMWLVLTEMYWE